ncbi:uncharacterized protein LOC131929940 [Physella acuta]|uniref:uncharacterized protein LOC131929940 n=1 Tax=Physella acuta TaxID=109671 RepID=UPI0027DC8A1C|nr:uncharacterized protein LOC131929940 [Physella acuta]
MYGKVMKFETDKPVQVMFLERSSCSEDGGDNPGEPGDPAMCLAIPTALFYDMYIFSTPNTKQVIPENYLTLVIEEPNKEILQFDDQKFPHDESVVWKPVLGMEEWVVGSIKTKPGTHALQGTRMFYFGCYLYGYHMHYGYMQPAGFMSSPIDDVENCENTQKSSSRGDLIDNDCDGRVDEELYDGWDNDHDGAADEDLAKPDRVNGGWAEWRAWGCTQNCSVTDEERFRRCTNPQPVNFGANCPGFNRQPRKGKCWIKTRCPTTCPKLRFGFECAKSCANCFTDCNKFNGTCNGTCVIGYQDLEEMCLIQFHKGGSA